MLFNKFFMTLATVALLLASSCSTFPTEQTDQAIQTVLEEFKAVGASVAVVKDGQIVYNKSFGYKDWENKTPLANDDLMRIASISKSFTATSLMQFVDQGVISLDDDISDLIGFTIRNPHHPDTPITLRMVLSHTASIRDKADYSTLDHLNPAINGDCADSFFEYKPGEGYNYSNLGLNLAGTILEKVSGVRFDQYVKENVINRLGLYGGHNVDSLDATKFARLYYYRDGDYVESTNAYRSPADKMPDYVMGYSAPCFSPTGGVKISAHDLAIYMMMHMNYGEYNGVRLISEESAKLMQTPVWKKQKEGEDQYGLCLEEFVNYIDDPKYNVEGNYPVGHTGVAYGLNSIMIWSPADGWGIAAMSNGFDWGTDKSFVQSLANAIYNACIKEQ